MSKNQYKSAKKALFLQKDFKNLPKNSIIIGVDEAGRGAWAGPVVAACIVWSGKNPLKNRLRDSKKMTEKDRKITYEEILKLSQEQKLSY
jgi:ribonuclease HII